jgi:hypothetical protein
VSLLAVLVAGALLLVLAELRVTHAFEVDDGASPVVDVQVAAAGDVLAEDLADVDAVLHQVPAAVSVDVPTRCGHLVEEDLELGVQAGADEGFPGDAVAGVEDGVTEELVAEFPVAGDAEARWAPRASAGSAVVGDALGDDVEEFLVEVHEVPPFGESP